MKKLLLITNLITAMALGTLLLNGCEDSPEISTPTTTTNIDNTCTACPNSQLPSAVPMSYFKSLISNYRNNHWSTINAHLNNRSSQVDSRSVWFDLNQLKGFIHAIETNVAAKCQGNHCDKQLGIRIYYGEYDNTTNRTYSGYHTLVMVPTMRNEDTTKYNTPEEHVDFDYRYLTNCKPQCLSAVTPELMALLPSITMGAMNHGGIIPPPDRICTGARFMDLVDHLDGIKPLCPCN